MDGYGANSELWKTTLMFLNPAMESAKITENKIVSIERLLPMGSVHIYSMFLILTIYRTEHIDAQFQFLLFPRKMKDIPVA